MTPVKQTKLYQKDAIHLGNCYAAALASMLDLPLWMVPPFEDMPEGYWFPRTQQWLRRMFGLRLVEFRGPPEQFEGQLPEFYIANGPSPRGVKHSVIFQNGKMIHDPHWTDDGIMKVEWIWVLSPVDETESPK